MEDFSVEEIDKIEEQVLSNSEESYQTQDSTPRMEKQADSTCWFDNLNEGPSSEGSTYRNALSNSVEFNSGEPYPKRLRT